ncbi:hypothetical protein EDB83DRAFT_2310790 [Lactarius deliciosus]|nr:hypothetical protein EDB83DRAFT_2310790 [Lactarius deliciosus]
MSSMTMIAGFASSAHVQFDQFLTYLDAGVVVIHHQAWPFDRPGTRAFECITCMQRVGTCFKVVLMDSHRLSRRGILLRYSSYPGGWGKKPTYSRQARAHVQCGCGGGVGGKRSHERAEKENAEQRWGEARAVEVKVWDILAIAQQEEVVTPPTAIRSAHETIRVQPERRPAVPKKSTSGQALITWERGLGWGWRKTLICDLTGSEKSTLRIDGCVHPPRALRFAGIAKHMSEKRTSSIDVGHKALGSWQGAPQMSPSALPGATCTATEEILTDNQGRRFEQVVGENPMPWSVDPYGAKRRWGRSLKKSSPRMLAILPVRGKGDSRRWSRGDDLFGS